MAKYNIQRGGGISHFTQDVNGNQHELRNLKKIAVETVEASKIVLNPETGEFYSGYPLMCLCASCGNSHEYGQTLQSYHSRNNQ